MSLEGIETRQNKKYFHVSPLRNRILSSLSFLFNYGKREKLKKQSIVKTELMKVKNNVSEDTEIQKKYVNTFLNFTKNVDTGIFTNEEKEILKCLHSGSTYSFSSKSYNNIVNLIDKFVRNQNFDKNLNVYDFTMFKFSFVPETIENTGLYNCTGASLMFSSIVKQLGGESYPIKMHGHAMSLVRQNGQYFIVDTRNKRIKQVSETDFELLLEPKNIKYGMISLKESFHGRTGGFLFSSLDDANLQMNIGNYRMIYNLYIKCKKLGLLQKVDDGERPILEKAFKGKNDLDVKAIKDLVEVFRGGEEKLLELMKKEDTLVSDVSCF